MSVDQILRHITFRLGVLVQLGRRIQAILDPSFGERPVVCVARTRIHVRRTGSSWSSCVIC